MARFRGEIAEKVTPIFANCKWPDLALIALFAGVGEELFFRGWLQGVLTNTFDVVLGVLIASAIFGLLHYLSATYAFYAF
jgi:membrane protease YdiL (CAAX protease family)